MKQARCTGLLALMAASSSETSLFTFIGQYGVTPQKITTAATTRQPQSLHNVTCIPIARQRLGKHNPAGANARDNRTSIAKQRISIHASLTIEVVFSAWSVRSGYKEVFGSVRG
jgi:hypothetical protein